VGVEFVPVQVLFVTVIIVVKVMFAIVAVKV